MPPPALPISPRVLRAWAEAYGMPLDYVATDLESSGLDLDRDWILQIGWCAVSGGEAVANASVSLNWVDDMSDVERQLFRRRLADTAASMEGGGRQYGWTVDRVATGRPPREAAATYKTACRDAEYLVAHYGGNFDYPMIDRFLRDNGGEGLPDLSSGKLLDTHVLVKAAAAGVTPRRGESYASAVSRVNAARTRTKCSMAACIGMLGLAGRGAVERRAHDAAYDSWLAHLVYERLRELAATD